MNDCLEEEGIESFNNTFIQLETNKFNNARSVDTHQMKRHDFKTGKDDCFSIFNKCLLFWNLL